MPDGSSSNGRHLRAVDDDELRPWDRQPRESEQTYQRFRFYLEAGPNRTFQRTADHFGVSLRATESAARRWEWTKRVAAYERQMSHAADESAMQVIRRLSAEQAKEARKFAVGLTAAADELLRRLEADPEYLAGMTRSELMTAVATAGRAHNRVVVTERLALGASTENLGDAPLDPRAAEFLERVRRMDEDELDVFLAGEGE